VAIRALIAVALLALVAPAASAQTASTPRSALLQQATLFKQAKWRTMYGTYTARFRRSCPYATFVQRQRQTRQILGTDFRLTGIQVKRETASRAVVAYRFVKNGRTVAQVTLRDRDVYTRIGTRWFDELDRVSTC